MCDRQCTGQKGLDHCTACVTPAAHCPNYNLLGMRCAHIQLPKHNLLGVYTLGSCAEGSRGLCVCFFSPLPEALNANLTFDPHL